MAYLCDIKRCLTWFIHSSGYGFKMEIPFDIIIDTEFTHAAPGSGLSSFILSQPPTFYLESFSPPHPGRGTDPVRHWKKCADWTEDQQATKVLRHDLVGSAVQLTHVLRHLNAHTSGSDIRLHSPSYHSHSQELSPTVLEVHPPLPAAFAGTGYHPQDSADLRQPGHPNVTHKQFFSSPDRQLPLRDESAHLPIAQPSSGVIPEPNIPMYSQYPQHPAIQVRQSTSYSNYSNTALPYHISHSSFSANRGSSRSFSPHGSHQRPYSAGSVHSLPYEDDSRALSLPDGFHPPGTAVPTPFGTPSPPLLTTAFYAAGSTSNICTVGPYDPAVPTTSGLPNSDTNS